MTPIVSGGIPPAGQDFNGILNAITNAIRWGNAGGQYPYDATFSSAIGGYPKGALLARSGFDGYWVSQVENNTTNPDTGGAGWAALSFQGSDYGVDIGTANAYAVTFAPAVVSLRDGMTLKFKALNANTGASTFSPSGITAAPIVGGAHSSLQGGEISPNGDVWVQWNSSIGTGSWVLIENTGGALQVASATRSQHAPNAGQIQSQSLTAFTTAGTAPAFTLNPSPAITALAAGQRFRASFNAAGTTGSNTLNVNGLGAKNLVQYDSTGALVSAIISSGLLTDVEYNGTSWVVLDPLPGQVNNLVGIQGAFKNLAVSATGTSAVVSITADEIVLESASNTYQTVRNVAVNPSLASSGISGLDTGTVAANTWYSVWVVWNSTNGAAGLLSLSATAPTLPGGWTHKARVGWVRTDGTANRYPLNFLQSGRRAQYRVGSGTNVTALPVIANASSPIALWTAIAVAAFVPPTAGAIDVGVISQSAASQLAWAYVVPNNSYSTTPSATAPVGIASGSYNTSLTASRTLMALESGNIYWGTQTSSGGSMGVYCAGWEDNL
ncbi:hypothetical protein [Pseudomonas asplenii]|nr:hypothetical protein [Pseudomonas fuscovaginae]